MQGFNGDCEKVLTELGFTQNQVKVYLALLKMGQLDARSLSACSQVPRQAVYRVLQELQDMGFVEKVIAAPCEFKPVPISDSMYFLIKRRAEDHRKLVKNVKFLIKQLEFTVEETSETEPTFNLIQGKERIIQLIKSKHDNAQKSVDIISNGRRWLQILYYCMDNNLKALKRGVVCRVITCQPKNDDFLVKLSTLLAKPNFKLGISGLVKTNIAIFDGKYATFNFYPAKMLGESPIILTNHPSFITMCQTHFEVRWKSAKKVEETIKGIT